uniref:RNase H type-1 domain-containing protein n=1 Tax=Spongospora subterranea TaxID=70186 RepID=A0A0H5R0T2_9EUKA|eukprot:CRZ07777.1 hypothetical protein [Spongospora subterranea]
MAGLHLAKSGESLRERVPKGYKTIHAKVDIAANILEALYTVNYHKSTRTEAIAKHKRNELLPRNPDVEIWTDGRYTNGKKGGAAALIRYKNTNGETANYTEEKSQIKLGRTITSSYEAEIIALHAGLELAID